MNLFNKFISSTPNYRRYSTLRSFKQSSDFFLRVVSRFIQFSYISNFFRRSLLGASSFFRHVIQVILLRSQKKMLRTNTLSIVTMMTDNKVGRDFSIMNLPAQSMCPDIGLHSFAIGFESYFIIPNVRQNSISSSFSALNLSSPLPATTVNLIDLCPESLNQSLHEPIITYNYRGRQV